MTRHSHAMGQHSPCCMLGTLRRPSCMACMQRTHGRTPHMVHVQVSAGVGLHDGPGQGVIDLFEPARMLPAQFGAAACLHGSMALPQCCQPRQG